MADAQGTDHFAGWLKALGNASAGAADSVIDTVNLAPAAVNDGLSLPEAQNIIMEQG